jgi:ferredoxin
MTKLFISLNEPPAFRAPARQTIRRPPGARNEPDFSDLCLQCSACVQVCPEGRIALCFDGTPMILGQGACIQCGLCADVCMHDAIVLTPRTRAGLEMVRRLERMTDAAKRRAPG